MKLKTLLVSALVISLMSCETDDDSGSGDGTGTPSITCYVDEVDETGDDDGQTWTKNEKFVYNSAMQLTEIEELDGGSLSGKDVISYNADGTINKIVSEDAMGNSNGDSSHYTYSGGEIVSIKEYQDTSGVPEMVTYTLTHSGGNLTGFEHDGDDGVNMENGVYTSGNMTSGSLFFYESGIKITIDFEATYDDKANIKAQYPNDGENAIEVVNKNNLVLVTSNSMVPDFINVGDTILYRTYEYNADGGVTKLTDHASKMNDNGSVTDYTVTCQ